MSQIVRVPSPQLDITLGNSLGSTPEIPYGACSGGNVIIPPNSAITGLNFYCAAELAAAETAASDTNGYVPAFDNTVPTPVAANYSGLAPGSTGMSVPIPDCCFGAKAIKIVTVQSSGTTAPVDLALKT
jgi:hypothetical protein